QAEQAPTVTNPAAATVNNDDAPDIYLQGNPGPHDPTTRAFERATGALTVTNPLSVAAGVPSTERLVQQQANPTEFQILHMLTADPLRTPSFTAFAQPDYYVTGGSATCSLDPAVPPALQSGGEDRAAYIQLAQLYKQLSAPVGAFGLRTLQASTLAMKSTSPGDGVYTCVESMLKAVGRQRDVVAGLILDLLNGAMRDTPSATSARRGMTLANRRLDARLIAGAYRVLAQSG